MEELMKHTTHRIEGRILNEQMRNAAELMTQYIEYAKRIGCTVDGDSIACTAKQADLLTTWWERNTR
jgi:hypothetical protein